MAGSVVVEELVTVLGYETDTKPLVDAGKAVDNVDAKNKAAAASTDRLTQKMDGLADQMQATADKSLALKEQQLRLQRQIEITGKPTAEQRKEMYRLKMELEDNALHARKLAASQKGLQRELKQTREETKKLADAERVQSKAAREAERAKKSASRDESRRRKEVEREQSSQARIAARGMKDDEIAKFTGSQGPEGKVARDELFKRRMNARAVANAAEDRKQNLSGLVKGGIESKTGISFSGMTAGAAVMTGAAAGVAALAAGMAALGSKVFDVSKHFQSLRASLITVTGSAANADKQFGVIREFAATTPFQVDQATEAFIKLKSLGIDASTKSLTAYGNTASAMGKPLNQLIEAVADAATGQFERLAEFGIKSKRVGDNVSFTFRGVTTTVKNNAEEIQGYLVALGENQFGGAMSLQMNTIGGAISNLEDKVDGFLLKIGEGGQMEGLKRIVQEVSDLLTDELATSLGELQAEGTGILEDLVGRVDPKDLEGIVKLLTLIVKNIRFMMQPVGFMLELALGFLGALGRVAELLFDTLGSLFRDVEKLASESFLGGLADKVSGLGENVGEFASGPLSDLQDIVSDTVPYTEELAYAWDAVGEALTGVKGDAEAAQGALLSLVSEAFTKKIQQIGNQLELKGKAFVQGATVETLQRMRAGGGELGKVADTEMARRASAANTAKEEELFQAGGGDKFKTDQLQQAQAGIEDAAGERADAVYRTARDNGASSAEATRMATVAKGEETQRLMAAYDATGIAPTKRKKGKSGKGKKPTDHGIEKIVKQRAEELGEQAGEREASRLTIAVSEGKSTMTIEDALEAGESKRKDVRDKVLRDFYSSGKLPPGVRSDLQRLTEIPSVEQQIGKIAPPVIAVTNIRVDARIATMNVGERGTFTGTREENGQALMQAIDSRLSQHLRIAIVDMTQGELP